MCMFINIYTYTHTNMNLENLYQIIEFNMIGHDKVVIVKAKYPC